MAPKKKAGKQSAAKAKAVKKAVAALPKAAVQKAKGEITGPRCNSQIVGRSEVKKTRSLDAEVKRAIETRYVGIEDSSMYGNIVNGSSFFDAVKARKVACALKGQYLDDDLWADMEKIYKIEVAQAVVVKDKKEAVDPFVVNALHACKTADMSQRSRASLCGWFQNCKSMNQRTLVGIVTNLSKLHPAASSNSAHV